MTRFHPVSRRTGVTASVSTRNRSAQMPVVSSKSSTGLIPRRPVSVLVTSQTKGVRHDRKTQTFAAFCMPLEIAPEIHTRIHRGNLVAVSVEHLRRPRQECADAALA